VKPVRDVCARTPVASRSGRRGSDEPRPLSTHRTIGSLCSGIGGLELGLERAGLGRVSWQVEADGYCREVLAKHWPDAARHEDVRTARGLGPVDVVCAGFPCQPVSVAGKRRGQSDERWLWPHIARTIGEVAPSIVVLENVLGLRSSGLRDVLADLAALGFDAEWADLNAWHVGAPHLRRRLFIAATHPERVQLRDGQQWLSRGLARSVRDCGQAVARDDAEAGVHTDSLRRLESARQFAERRGWSEQCGWSIGRAPFVDDGISTGVPRGSFGAARKALGNAVVVACSEAVGRALVEALS
jgi:DNA (cytosine-5)-methyltransferase 1